MNYNLIVKGFGKIREAEIQTAPLTLFVGDNNSGKSYLLSLIWMLHSSAMDASFLDDLSRLKTEKYMEVKNKLAEYFKAAYMQQQESIVLSVLDLEELINEIFEKRKKAIATSIFNDINVDMDTLRIKILDEEEFTIRKLDEGNSFVRIQYVSKNFRGFFMIKSDGLEWHYSNLADFAIRRLVMWVLNGNGGGSIYLPAARTGFMLAKDVINRAGRQETFGVISGSVREYNKYEAFTKPIIEFLNTLEELDIDHVTKYQDLVDWIEGSMTHGKVKYEEVLRKEVKYLPQGQEEPISLRTASAVVTELSPLVLILKYCRRFHEICYEEPEMCLHPQLQAEMGKLLIRLVNEGKHVVATTHSDIILQHVNNMCRAANAGLSEELMEKFSLGKKDLISADKTAIYQFRDEGAYSTVESVPFENEAFHVPTFTDALMGILEQTTEIQDYEG